MLDLSFCGCAYLLCVLGWLLSNTKRNNVLYRYISNNVRQSRAMHALVLSKVTRDGESLPTHIAGVRPLACVHASMHSQIT